MATKYSMDILDAETREWTPVALFSDILPSEVLADMGRTMWNNVDGAGDIAITDMDTGEVVWCHTYDVSLDDYALECLEHADDCSPDWEPTDSGFDHYFDECGFDPYLGCYTDDC